MINFSNWKKYQIGSIFEISKYGDVENVRGLEDGNVKYISTSRFNNGLSRKVSNTNYNVEEGNCITVGIDGSFSVFYQPDYFIRTTNIATLRNENLNKYNALYIISVIRVALSIYYYGLKLKKDDILAKLEILLPSDKDGAPDWKYMNDYIKEIYVKSKASLTSSIKKDVGKINFENWKEVKLVDIFDYQRGQRYKDEDHVPGKLPYISSSELYNGVDDYVEPRGRSKVYHDCLTMANSGSRGIVFYHEGEFVASDHVHVLWLKDKTQMCKEVGLFLKPIIEKNADRFLFNKEINNDTINEITLFLPYKDGNPDWEFMKRYITELPNFDLI